jgi:hypothetical protein
VEEKGLLSGEIAFSFNIFEAVRSFADCFSKSTISSDGLAPAATALTRYSKPKYIFDLPIMGVRFLPFL